MGNKEEREYDPSYEDMRNLEILLLLAKTALDDIKRASLKGDETPTELECHYLASDALDRIRSMEDS